MSRASPHVDGGVCLCPVTSPPTPQGLRRRCDHLLHAHAPPGASLPPPGWGSKEPGRGMGEAGPPTLGPRRCMSAFHPDTGLSRFSASWPVDLPGWQGGTGGRRGQRWVFQGSAEGTHPKARPLSHSCPGPCRGDVTNHPGSCVGRSAAAKARMATEVGTQLPFPGPCPPWPAGRSQPHPRHRRSAQWDGGMRAAPVPGNGSQKLLRRGPSKSHLCRCCGGGEAH